MQTYSIKIKALAFPSSYCWPKYALTLFLRRRKMKNHFYIPSSQSQRDDVPLWDLESLDNDSGKTPVPANIFVQHVDLLHGDGGIGFQKEYDYILSSTSPKTGRLRK